MIHVVPYWQTRFFGCKNPIYLTATKVCIILDEGSKIFVIIGKVQKEIYLYKHQLNFKQIFKDVRAIL